MAGGRGNREASPGNLVPNQVNVAQPPKALLCQTPGRAEQNTAVEQSSLHLSVCRHRQTGHRRGRVGWSSEMRAKDHERTVRREALGLQSERRAVTYILASCSGLA